MRDFLQQHNDIRHEYLKVAEGGVYLDPTVVQTVLGSCLGVAFHVPSKGIGAFFHAFLPRCADFEKRCETPGYRFVDTAITSVMERFTCLGVRPDMLKVGLVGGANGLVREQAGVGGRNVEVAYETLEQFGIRPEFAEVGGRRGRKVVFLSSTGELRIAKLRKFVAPAVRSAG